MANEISTELEELARGNGPYLARVVNHLDTTFMGRLEVKLYLGSTINSGLSNGTTSVSYLPAFAGQTSTTYEGNNSSRFNDVQKSYGMWFVPPDVGSIVMVIFVNGDYNAGYWFGCVPDQYQNHMVPGIAASRNSAMTPEQKKKYMTDNVPVAEFHKSSRDMSIPGNDKISTFTKPVHPFADRLLAQGLLLDDIRGITSSSARREAPSGVFGISTPGPIDDSQDAQKGNIGYGNQSVPAFVSRLGGHTLVMDDGDRQGLNELFRIRTRTGHQILLHNSSDLIYIANAAGTAWIELTSQGKIDIYSADSISMRTEGDFNLHADRDFNIEAGRSVNIAAGADLHADVTGDYIVNGSRDAKMTFGSNAHLKTGSNIHLAATGAFNAAATGAMKLGSLADLNIVGKTVAQGSAGDFNISAGGNLLESAGEIHMNGPVAAPAVAPDDALTADPLPLYSLPNRSPAGGWSSEFYKAEDIISIMKRAPTHEPWDQHENVNPTKFSADNTDLGNSDTANSPAGTPSVTYNRAPQVQGTPPTPTGDIPTDNIAAFLWMIRVCEGTSGPDGYRTMFTGKLFEGYTRHPNQAITSGRLTSTAAGAYQFLYSTWLACQRALNLPDFSPASQDKACIHLLKTRRALDDVKTGNFTKAVAKCNKEWASLPGSPYNQNPKPLNVALSLYKQGGGIAVA